MANCKNCQIDFEITDQDREFYRRVDVPEPTHCPDCRQQRRLAHRTRNFYLKKCDLCGKNTMSMYAPEIEGYQFYCNECWWSDKWDGFNYGRDFDFSRPFFEQFDKLYRSAPKHISNTNRSVNCEYIINAHKCKNCYMLDEVDFGEDCYYGYCLQYSKDCVDCIYTNKSELGYELVKCENCYNTFYAFNAHNCHDCTFIANCRGCSDCFFCTNLRNVKNYLFNKPASPEKIAKARGKYFCGDYQALQEGIKIYQDLVSKMTRPHLIGAHNKNSTGNYLVNTDNCLDCFGLDNSKDCRYCTDMHYSKDCYDIHIYVSELSYECLHAGPEGYHQIGSHLCWYCSDVTYCDECHNSQDLFGCASLRKQKYCILNKQYSEEEYKKLRDKIIAHMKETGEWGEYFSAKYSPHSYDQTYAQEFYPLTKREVKEKGWNWIDIKEKQYKASEVLEIPNNINDFKDEDLGKVFKCQESGKYFKITKAELDFYKKHNLPLPRVHPTVRLSDKIKQTGSRKLCRRKCDSCNLEIQTVYTPNKVEKVYCEKCYQKEIY